MYRLGGHRRAVITIASFPAINNLRSSEVIRAEDPPVSRIYEMDSRARARPYFFPQEPSQTFSQVGRLKRTSLL